MELLGTDPAFDLSGDTGGRIYARNYAMPSSFISKKSKNVNSLIAEGCEIYGTVMHSVLSTGCTVEEDAIVEDSVIMPNVKIEKGAIIRHAIVGEDCVICRGAVIGGTFAPDEKKQIAVIGKNKVIEANEAVKPGEIR